MYSTIYVLCFMFVLNHLILFLLFGLKKYVIKEIPIRSMDKSKFAKNKNKNKNKSEQEKSISFISTEDSFYIMFFF